MSSNVRERTEEIIKSLMISHDDSENGEESPKETLSEYLEYIDSIRFIELITAVESEFGIEICNEDLVLNNVKSIDLFVDMVSKYVK